MNKEPPTYEVELPTFKETGREIKKHKKIQNRVV
jgi:hypothetical protein